MWKKVREGGMKNGTYKHNKICTGRVHGCFMGYRILPFAAHRTGKHEKRHLVLEVMDIFDTDGRAYTQNRDRYSKLLIGSVISYLLQ